jgi:hypothetical protein
VKLEFLKAWRCHKPGAIAEIPDGVAGELLKRRWARLAADAQPDPAIVVNRLPRKRANDGVR